jgi:hypothetical protein
VSEIKVGDLVMVVRDCCGHDIGKIATLESAHPADEWASQWECGRCGARLQHSLAIGRLPSLSSTPREKRRGWWPLRWLKRIPPLDELERDQIVKELSV